MSCQKNKPMMIFIFGPTGSGKTKVRDVTLEKLKVQGDTPHIGIDDLIERDPNYKRAISQILDKYDFSIYNVKDKIQIPEVITEFETAYWNARKHLDIINDKNFYSSIESGKTMTIEITGANNFEWYVNMLVQKGYMYEWEIYVSAAVVDFKILMQRNTTRAIKQITDFLQNQDNNAPRLPDLSKLRAKVGTIALNLDLIRNKCVKDSKAYILYYGLNIHKSLCGPNVLDGVFVFDTSNEKISLLEEIYS